QMSVDEARAPEPAVERGAPDERQHEWRKPPAGELQRTVIVNEARPEQSPLRVLLERGDHRRQRSLGEGSIAVEEHRVGSGRSLEPAFTCGDADVAVEAHDLDFRMLLGNP